MRLLFMQGPANAFFLKLANAAAGKRHEVLKLNYCGGDTAFWKGHPAISIRQPLAQLPVVYNGLLDDFRPDAIALFGDRRVVHAPMLPIAFARHIPCWVFDEGYFRPNWLTMDFGGTHRASIIPRDPALVERFGHSLPEPAKPNPFPSAWGKRGLDDTVYRMTTGLAGPLFRHYRSHRPVPAWREYGGWIKREFLDKFRHRIYRAGLEAAMSWPGPLFFLPLQLDADSQVRLNSGPARMSELIALALESFAKAAPADAALAIKRHPLDDGRVDRYHLVHDLVRQYALDGRVFYFAGGDTTRLVERSAGVVTLSSTVGALALLAGIPVKALGTAVYTLPGLVSNQSLDDFWQNPIEADPKLFDAFRKLVISYTQINGNLYDQRGQEHAADLALRRIESPEMWWTMYAATQSESHWPALAPTHNADSMLPMISVDASAAIGTANS